MLTDGWYNYDHEGYDYLDKPPFDSPQEALPYIPKWPGARNRFLLLIEYKGYTVPQAMIEVLQKLVPPTELTDDDLSMRNSKSGDMPIIDVLVGRLEDHDEEDQT